MQIKKGKVLFGFKDTFSVNNTLSKVILAGLLKYKEVINAKWGRKGIPASISQELIEQGKITYQKDFQLSDEDCDKCSDYFDHVLDEMIYAFEDNEPDIMLYDFKHTFVEDSVQHYPESTSGTYECSNEHESERYTSDMKAHNERCLEGRLLFAKFFDSLWW